MTLRDVWTLHGVMGRCPQCQGHWANRETSLFLLIIQAVERVWELGSEGRCSLDLHDVRPQDARCPQCPKEARRCPSCAARMWPGELHQQRVEVCCRCPGLWMEKDGFRPLRWAQPQRTRAWSPGQGGSSWLGRAVMVVVIILCLGLLLSDERLSSLHGALWQFIHTHLGH